MNALQNSSLELQYSHLVVLTVGIPETELLKANIYPNPANDIVNIIVENDIILNIALLDIQGKIISLEEVNDYHTQIDLSNRENAVFLLKITTTKGVRVVKLLKE